MSDLSSFLSLPLPSANIVGGTAIEEGRFTFQAALLNNGVHFCSGSLIAPNVVLTSVQCIISADPTHVALGCNDIGDLGDCEVIAVKSKKKFPGYQSGTADGDIELLLLEEESAQKAATLASPGLGLIDGTDLTVIGWESNETSGNESIPMLEITVEQMNLEGCNRQYVESVGFEDTPNNRIISNFSICAGADGSKECTQDTGGPIILRCDATEEEDVQIGFLTFGTGCFWQDFDTFYLPGIYASVTIPEVFEFINDFVIEQGHSLETVSSFDEFCVVNGTQPSEELSNPPTPFPTVFLTGWDCNDEFYNNSDGCHCDCGIPDPDCELDNKAVNCGDESDICVNNKCVETTKTPTTTPVETTTQPSASPTKSPTQDLSNWTCAIQSFSSNDGCDCNCGMPDPDCELDSNVKNCPGETDVCVSGVCVQKTESPSQAPTVTAASANGDGVSTAAVAGFVLGGDLIIFAILIVLKRSGTSAPEEQGGLPIEEKDVAKPIIESQSQATVA